MSSNNQRRSRSNSGRRPFSGGMGGRHNNRDNRGGNNYRDNKSQRDRDDSRSVGTGNANRAIISPWQTGTAPAPLIPSYQTFQPAPMMMQQGVQRVEFGNQGFRGGYGSGQSSKMAMTGMNFNAGTMIGVPNAQLMTFQPQQQQPMHQQQQHSRPPRDFNTNRNNVRNRSPPNSNRADNRNSAYYGKTHPSNSQDYKKRQRPRSTFGDRNSSSGSQTKPRSRSRSRDIKDRLGRKEVEGAGIRRRLSDPATRKRPRVDRSPIKDSIEETSKSEAKNEVDGLKEDVVTLDEVGESVDMEGKDIEGKTKCEEEKVEETSIDAEDDKKKESRDKSERSKSKERSTKERSKDRRHHEDDFPCEALACHICDLDVFTSKTGFIRHLQGITHERMAKLYHSKNAAKLELLEVTVKLLEMRQRDKCLRETGNRHATIKKTIEHDLMRQVVKPHYCCDTRFSSPFDLEEHKLTLVHLRNEYEKNGKKKKNDDSTEVHDDEDFDQNIDVMIEESRVSAKLCPINLADPPLYDPSEAFGLEFLNKENHYHCSLCKKNNAPKSVMMHCQSSYHYDSVMKHFRKEKEKREKESEMLKEEAAKLKEKNEEEEEGKEKEKEKDIDLDSIEKNVVHDFVKEVVNEEAEYDPMEEEEGDENDCENGERNDGAQDDDYGDINEDNNAAEEDHFQEEFCDGENEDDYENEGDNDNDNEDEKSIVEDDYEYNYEEAQEAGAPEIEKSPEHMEDKQDPSENTPVKDDGSVKNIEDELDNIKGESPLKEAIEPEVIATRTRRRKGRPSLSRN